jgi:hypothetical protein
MLNDLEARRDIPVDEGLEREPERRLSSSDVVPVEADGQEPETFVTLGTTEQLGEDEVIALGQAENGDTGEQLILTIRHLDMYISLNGCLP